MNKYKPSNYPDVSIYLMSEDADAVVEFSQYVFDGRVLRHETRSDGTISHGEIQIGDSVIMISQANDEYPAFPVWIHVFVKDVDAIFGRAKAYGATVVQAPSSSGDGDRRGGVLDGSGNIWWMATSEA
jgi:uncharacterized glyoxalase superfamily protein PhnB